MNMNDVPMPTIKLTEEQGNNLILAIVSTSYEEYAMRCAVSGIEPIVSPAAFRLNRNAKDNSQ